MQDDLDLINLAIDYEEEDGFVEDWTLKLNVDLRQSVKFRPKLLRDTIHNALIMDALFADTPASSVVTRAMIFRWQDTKLCSNRKLNNSIKKFSKTVDVEVIDNISEAQIPKKRRIGVDVIAPSAAEDVEAHTSMEMEGRSESCATTLEKSRTDNGEQSDLQNEFSFVVTDNTSLEHDSVDGLMQEDTELAKVGGSSADEPAIDSNDMDFKKEKVEVLCSFASGDASLNPIKSQNHLKLYINFGAEKDENKAMEISPGFKRTSIYLIGINSTIKTKLGRLLPDGSWNTLVIEAVGGETASKQDMDKSAYVRHNMPHHKARLKVKFIPFSLFAQIPATNSSSEFK
ncbi:hypothetical protein Tco_1403667 [Tanacetum coccineum]